MTGIKTFHTNIWGLLIPVPTGSKNFTLINSHSYFHSPRLEHSVGGIDLPDKCRIDDLVVIGLASELTKERMYDICESMNGFWKDYESINDFGLINVENSFISFLNYHECIPDKTVIVVPKNKETPLWMT